MLAVPIKGLCCKSITRPTIDPENLRRDILLEQGFFIRHIGFVISYVSVSVTLKVVS